jgi:hypothetical protein
VVEVEQDMEVEVEQEDLENRVEAVLQQQA